VLAQKIGKVIWNRRVAENLIRRVLDTL